MIILAALVALLAIGLSIRLVCDLVLHAGPLWCGGGLGWWSWHLGIGPVAALAVGFAGAIVALALVHLLCRAPSLTWRMTGAVLLAVPAAIAGYCLAHGLSGSLITPRYAVIAASLAAALASGGAATQRALEFAQDHPGGSLHRVR